MLLQPVDPRYRYMFDDEVVNPDCNSADVDGYIMANSRVRTPRHLFVIPETIDIPFDVPVNGKVEFVESTFGHEVNFRAIVK